MRIRAGRRVFGSARRFACEGGRRVHILERERRLTLGCRVDHSSCRSVVLRQAGVRHRAGAESALLVAEEPKCDPGLEGELSRSGDPVLARHIGNCVARVTPVGTLISKAHPDSPQRIDCAVASVIAYERAAWHRVNTVECGVIYA